MKQISTVCPRDCYDTCSLIVTIGDEEEVLSVEGDPRNPVTQGFACPRGAKDQARLYKNRVEAPVIRQGKGFERVDWEEALDVSAQKLGGILEEYGPEAVLFLDYAGNTGLLTGAFPRRLWNSIGATQTDRALCCESGHEGLALHYGNSHGITPTELREQKLIVFWGFNAAVSSPHIWSLAQQARRSQGARIVVIDPRKSRTAKKADLWIQPRCGSDVGLVYGLINYLIQNDCVNLEFVEKWTSGFEHLKEEAGKWTPDRVERVTGVSWELVKRLGDAYGQSTPSATMIGIGLQKSAQGADQVRAVSFIPALLGLHRGFFYSNGRAFFVDEAFISGRTLTKKSPKIVEQVALSELVKNGKFKFIYISGMNPAVTLPNAHFFREGLWREDIFVIVHETHWTKTTQYADVVLSAPTYLEKEDLVIPWSHNFVQYSARAIAPINDSRCEWWVMREFAKRLGLTENWLYENPWRAIELAHENAFEGGCFEELRLGKMLRLKMKPKDCYPTSSGKIEFYSTRAEKMGLKPLPTQVSLYVGEEQFVLLTSATPKYTHTQFQEVYGPIPPVVTINPQDAEKLNFQAGDEVMLANERGHVQMNVVVSNTVPEGVVWCPRLSEGLAGEPQNGLMSSVPQSIGSGPRFNSTKVTIQILTE
ncbi:MAG: formate dehydrogenase [Chloroflexota bacterium]|nr:MAG: formate dehydrogenase [Chloroflexota bacterium]